MKLRTTLIAALLVAAASSLLANIPEVGRRQAEMLAAIHAKKIETSNVSTRKMWDDTTLEIKSRVEYDAANVDLPGDDVGFSPVAITAPNKDGYVLVISDNMTDDNIVQKFQGSPRNLEMKALPGGTYKMADKTGEIARKLLAANKDLAHGALQQFTAENKRSYVFVVALKYTPNGTE